MLPVEREAPTKALHAGVNAANVPTRPVGYQADPATMQDVVTGAVAIFADTLRSHGHQLTLPDLYAGATFATVDQVLTHAEQIGLAREQVRQWSECWR